MISLDRRFRWEVRDTAGTIIRIYARRRPALTFANEMNLAYGYRYVVVDLHAS